MGKISKDISVEVAVEPALNKLSATVIGGIVSTVNECLQCVHCLLLFSL